MTPEQELRRLWADMTDERRDWFELAGLIPTAANYADYMDIADWDDLSSRERVALLCYFEREVLPNL